MTEDAELASVLRKLIASDDSFLALDTHDAKVGQPRRFTLDDTRVEVTQGEAEAIKRVVGW